MSNRRIATALAALWLCVAACGSPVVVEPGVPASHLGPSGPPSAGAVQSTAPTASGPAAPIHVTGLVLRADPAESIGTCPVKVTFSATITADGRGNVAYRWRSSDGDVSPVEAVAFAGPGSLIVSSSWTVDASKVPTHAGWSSIEVVDAAPGAPPPTAEPAAFTFTCPDDDDVEAIGFGIGGSDADCSIAKALDTFRPDDHIRMVANYWPSLQAGTVVTFRLTQGRTVVDGYPVTVTLHDSTQCVRGSVSNGHLAPGHYRLDVEPDTARAIGGEFDVR